ncbi:MULTISPECIES: transposase [unclassified Streptomyces]|uniref:transposase n=1 Tax=unclassified Streptomyces TaxID=2593676 RepID=UPI0033B0B26B
MRRHELLDADGEFVGPLPPEPLWGRKRLDDRGIPNGIVWMFRTGVARRDVPERYGSWATLPTRFRRWAADGTFDRMLQNATGVDQVGEDVVLPLRGPAATGGSSPRRPWPAAAHAEAGEPVPPCRNRRTGRPPCGSAEPATPQGVPRGPAGRPKAAPRTSSHVFRRSRRRRTLEDGLVLSGGRGRGPAGRR